MTSGEANNDSHILRTIDLQWLNQPDLKATAFEIRKQEHVKAGRTESFLGSWMMVHGALLREVVPSCPVRQSAMG